jgi:hypothetical protein
MKPIAASGKDRLAEMIQVAAESEPNPWGKRLLNRFKTVNGRRFQLHATRGWKCIGRVKK